MIFLLAAHGARGQRAIRAVNPFAAPFPAPTKPPSVAYALNLFGIRIIAGNLVALASGFCVYCSTEHKSNYILLRAPVHLFGRVRIISIYKYQRIHCSGLIHFGLMMSESHNICVLGCCLRA